MPSHRRVNWEFQAVLQGKMSPTEGRDPQSLRSSTLWLFPPGKSHGWCGVKERECVVFVAHFSSVPEPLARLAQKHGYLEVKISPADKLRLRSHARTLHANYWRPLLVSELHTQKVLMDLGLMLLRHYPEAQQPLNMGPNFERIVAAEEWLRSKLRSAPKLSEAAKAVGLSSSQLNRLFLKIRGESPKQFLVRARIAQAMRLLARGNSKLEAIAGLSGFSSASNLCRAFRTEKGCSPTRWRRETLIKYRKPSPETHQDVGTHGRRDRRGL